MTAMISSIAELEALYGQPSEASILKEANRLVPEYRAFIEAAPFVLDAERDPRAVDGDLDTHVLPRIALVAVENGVRERFRDADTEVQAETRAVEGVGAATIDQVGDRGLDHPQVAGKLEHELRAIRNAPFRLLGRETSVH